MIPKTDPRHPGAYSDDHCDPHARISTSANAHAGLGRSDNGAFKAMPQGGESAWGDAMVAKYKPGGGRAPSNDVPKGAELNEAGDGYGSADEDAQ
jgi:hypothetical protein